MGRDSFLQSEESFASQSPCSSEDDRNLDASKDRKSDKRGRGERDSSKRRDRYWIERVCIRLRSSFHVEYRSWTRLELKADENSSKCRDRT